MSALGSYVRRGLSLPPQEAARRALGLGGRLLAQQRQRRRDARGSTYLDAAPAGELRRRVQLSDDAVRDACRPQLLEAASRYAAHRFDLLGSGWVEVRHGMACAGFGGHRFPAGPTVEADADGDWLAARVHAGNLAESRRLWRLIDGPYTPIDWQLDFRSGFRWSAATHCHAIRFGDVAGADVKVPWELARLQHLPQLALAHRAGQDTARAFRNQVLDFLATNPPRYGVNWAGPMDVAIRLVNVLLALDLYRDAGAAFDPPFLDAVKRAAVEHTRHVLAHLEWSEEERGNHYLAQLAGVAFAGAYLPASDETRGWLRFAAEQLALEVKRQFLPDGGSFEASTNYHRLSGEIAVFTAALLLGLDDDEVAAIKTADRPNVRPAPAPLRVEVGLLPHATFTALAKAARFTRALTKPGGAVVQIGDTDSGRLVKLQPAWDDALTDNPLDHRAFVAAVGALTGGPVDGAWAEADVVRALAGGRTVFDEDVPAYASVANTPPGDILAQARSVPGDRRRIIEVPLPPAATDGLELAVLPDFGVFVLRSARLFVSLRCPANDGPPPGHAHDDVLAVEIELDGRALLTDPGSYAYTPLPDARNRYRGAAAHCVPRPVGAGAVFDRGLFEIAGLPRGRCLHVGPEGLVGRADGAGWHVFRAVVLDRTHLTLVDLSPDGPLADWDVIPVSPGYGQASAHPACAL